MSKKHVRSNRYVQPTPDGSPYFFFSRVLFFYIFFSLESSTKPSRGCLFCRRFMPWAFFFIIFFSGSFLALRLFYGPLALLWPTSFFFFCISFFYQRGEVTPIERIKREVSSQGTPSIVVPQTLLEGCCSKVLWCTVSNAAEWSIFTIVVRSPQ